MTTVQGHHSGISHTPALDNTPDRRSRYGPERATRPGEAAEQFRFPAARDLKNAMIAARTIMRCHSNPLSSCIIAAHAGINDHLEVLATDGHRAMRTTLNVTRSRPAQAITTPIPREAVSWLANAHVGDSLRIDVGAVELQMSGRTNRPLERFERYYDEGLLHRLNPILVTDPPGPICAGIPRTAALRTLQTLPHPESQFCRIVLDHKGLNLWGRPPTGPATEPDARFHADGLARFNTKIVLNISKKYLADALKTMRAPRIDVVIAGADTPLILGSTNGWREHMAIMPSSPEHDTTPPRYPPATTDA